MEHEADPSLRSGDTTARAASSASERAALAGALPGYEIGGELGRGACGVVLAGRHRELGREVAIKRLPRLLGADRELRARFCTEARLLASLDHPHIVRIYDFVEVDAMCALVMQRLEGGTVADRLERGEISRTAACAVTLATCSALQYAHTKSVLHRDIKPQNLMFSDEGVLKVTDFGIAEALGGRETAARGGHVLGTPPYMAPEQAQGAPPSAAVDVYAAGVVLYVLLCGTLPFPPAADPMTELYQRVHREPVPLLERDSEAPAALADVTARALARDPAARYASALDLAMAVSRAAAREWGPAWAAASGVAVLDAKLTTDRPPAPPRRATSPKGDERAWRYPDAFYVAGADHELIDELQRALAAPGRRERSASRLHALCRLAIELHLAGAPAARCRALIAEAREIAGARDEPAADLVVRHSDLTATWSPDDLPGRLTGAGELIARAQERGDADSAFRGRRLRLRALLEAGDDAAADREIVALDAAATELGEASRRWQALLYRATAALRDGRTEDARGLALAARELGETVEPDLARRCFDDHACRVRLLARPDRELIPALRAAAESCPWLAVRRAVLVFGFVAAGRRTEALVSFEHLAREDFACVPRDANWLAAMVLLSLACAGLGDRRRARVLHEALAPYRDRVAVTGDCTVTWGPVTAALEALAAML